MHTFERKGLVYVDARAEGRGRFSLGVKAGDHQGIARALEQHFGTPRAVTVVPTSPTLQAVYTTALATHYASVKDRAGVASRWEHGVVKYGRTKDAAFGPDTPVAAVTKEGVALFRAWFIADGNDPKTANRKVALVSKLLHLAEEWGYIAHAPKIKRPKEKRGRIRWLTDAEEATMLAFMRAGAGGAQRPSGGSWVDGVFVPVTGPLVPRSGSEDFADAIAVLIDTGMRLGELLRAKDRDLTFGAEPSIYVPESKGDAQRTIPLSERAALIFSRRLRRDREADEKERGTSKPFGMLTVDRCDTLWAHAREAMGLARDEEFVIHALRHTFAKRIVDGDVDIRVLSYLMGHRRLETTMIYAHVSNRAARRAMKQAEAVRAGVLESAPMLTAVREVATER